MTSPSRTTPSAAQRWREMVEGEHAQSERTRESGQPPADHWAGVAERFREDPRRPMEPSLKRLSELIEPRQTVIDVGAGAGRLALPLALHCGGVVAVEPSPSMAAILTEEAARHQTSNVTIVQSEWEDASVAPADVTLCVNVLYTVPDVVGFIRKLEAHSRERVIIVLHAEHPQAQTYPFWRLVHGEERLRPPGLLELMQVLWEMIRLPRPGDAADQAPQRLREPGGRTAAAAVPPLPGPWQPEGAAPGGGDGPAVGGDGGRRGHSGGWAHAPRPGHLATGWAVGAGQFASATASLGGARA